MLTFAPPEPPLLQSWTKTEAWPMRDLMLHLAAVEQAAVEAFERRRWRLL